MLQNALGLESLISSIAEVFVFAVIIGAFALFFIVAISNRNDSDPSGSRPMAAYLFSGAFLFLWVGYVGLVLVADALVNLIGSHSVTIGTFTIPGPSLTNTTIRACVAGGLLVVFAGGAYLLHLARGKSLADAEADPSGPTKRIMRSYVAIVSFLAIIVTIFALIAAAWLVFAMISPTIFASASLSRTAILRSLLDAVVLIILAGGIFGFHQQFAPEHLRLLTTGGGGRHSAQPHDDDASSSAIDAAPAS
jgi:hypothetical protein